MTVRELHAGAALRLEPGARVRVWPIPEQLVTEISDMVDVEVVDDADAEGGEAVREGIAPGSDGDSPRNAKRTRLELLCESGAGS